MRFQLVAYEVTGRVLAADRCALSNRYLLKPSLALVEMLWSVINERESLEKSSRELKVRPRFAEGVDFDPKTKM